MSEKSAVTIMNELLEAELAGIIVYEQMSFLSSTRSGNRMLAIIRNNESRDCGLLHSLISQRDIRPTDNMNDFADKVLALENENERIQMLIKGSSWIARKVSEIFEFELTEEEHRFFITMRNQHMWNIGVLRELLKPETERELPS